MGKHHFTVIDTDDKTTFTDAVSNLLEQGYVIVQTGECWIRDNRASSACMRYWAHMLFKEPKVEDFRV